MHMRDKAIILLSIITQIDDVIPSNKNTLWQQQRRRVEDKS